MQPMIKTLSPPDVTGFSASLREDGLTLKWDEVVDDDLSSYQIRWSYWYQGWDESKLLILVTKGTLITNVKVPTDAKRFILAIKAMNVSGAESVTEAVFHVGITEEMIDAGAAKLKSYPFLDGQTNDFKDTAREVLPSNGGGEMNRRNFFRVTGISSLMTVTGFRGDEPEFYTQPIIDHKEIERLAIQAVKK